MKSLNARVALGSVLMLFSAMAAAAEECPATFEEFMTSFEASPEYQATHTKFPLVYRHADSTKPDAAIVEESIADAAAYKAIQYPSPAQQKEQSLARKDSRDRGGAVNVRLESSDAALQYRFIKIEECWALVRMEKGAVTTQIAPSVNL